MTWALPEINSEGMANIRFISNFLQNKLKYEDNVHLSHSNPPKLQL